MRFPSTLLEFQAQFPDEASCWAYLRRARWPRGFLCPGCGGRGSHQLAARRLEQCRSCRYQGSVTAGTDLNAVGVRGGSTTERWRCLSSNEGTVQDLGVEQ